MTKKFHEGQEVEVWNPCHIFGESDWRKAKILECEVDYYLVQFHDGTRYTFDEAHIREVSP